MKSAARKAAASVASAIVAVPDAPRMSLAGVRNSRRRAPDRILLVGVEGIGKSTFGADSPDPIFIAAEDGLRHLDVPVFPQPQNFGEIRAAIAELRTGEHEYRTVVFDTLDWIEPLIWDHVCAENKWDSIEAPGYGKGYVVVTETWREFLADLERLRNERNMEVILLAHAQIKTFSNPAGPDYARYESKLDRRAAALVKEWTDCNLFAVHEEYAEMRKDRKGVEKPTGKATSTGLRIIHTERTAAWDAKNRHGLPPELPLSYEAYAEAREKGQPASADALLAEAGGLLPLIAEEKREQVAAFIDKHKDNPTQLAKIVNRLRTLASANEGGE